MPAELLAIGYQLYDMRRVNVEKKMKTAEKKLKMLLYKPV